MSEIERVFARFRDDKSPAGERREIRNIPQRGPHVSRTVTVVHVRSGVPTCAADRARPPAFGVRAASWEDGFPARDAAPPFPKAPTPTAAPVTQTYHLMPARLPSVRTAEASPTVPHLEPVVAVHRSSGQPRKQTSVAPIGRVADPFDASDDGANCLRCGHLVEQARERRGLMTCASCG